MDELKTSFLAATGRALGMTPKLKLGIGAVLLANAVLGAIVTWLLPYEVVNGQVQAPAVDTGQALLSRGLPALVLYIVSLLVSVFLLGGILKAVGKCLQKESIDRAGFFQGAQQVFGAMIRWGIVYFALVLGSALLVATLAGFLWAIGGQIEIIQTIGAVLTVVVAFAVGIAGIFSVVLVTDKGLGPWKAFAASTAFVKAHKLGTLGLLFLVSLFGALLYWVWVGVGLGVNGVRQALGIAEFAPGLPVFFFGLILGFPQAFLTAFIPAALSIYHAGNPPAVKPTGEAA